jgi:Inosine-uridine preferring nucleoside hydrolase/FmdE, Molybdenum formylmethanofuran dehydrogenase operon
MKRFYLIAISLFFTYTLSAHPWKPSNYVIIDTDGGIDDMRAITMLLASPDVRVLAITVSPGVLSAEHAYIKVRSLLNSFYHEGIPVGVNRISKYKPEEFPFALQTTWGDESGIHPEDAADFSKVIADKISCEKTKIRFVSLGSMSTAWNALRNIPEFRNQVKDFIWSADGAEDKAGFNYNIDREASQKMLRQEIPVKIVRKFDLPNMGFYNYDLIRSITGINTPYAKKISELFRSEQLKDHDFLFQGTDDMVPVFIHYPDLFLNKVIGNVSDCTPADEPGIKTAVLKILRGETVAANQVIKNLPVDPSFYFDDINPAVNEIIERYGINEWTSGVLANELHRHLGVFAIIGVKMGIRAREYFDTGVDEFHAVSYAGSDPPLSCMNDGIQVSTGATPGHGLLTVRNDTVLSPSADFTYLNRKIRLTLKPELAQKISSELKEINFIYGLDSNIYWELVRKNTIKYWRELDRHNIFLIEEIY